jgi:hypothetical protein
VRAQNPHARLFQYVDCRYHPIGGGTVDMVPWAQSHGYDPEDFYLHYQEDVNVPTWEGVVIVPGFPAGVVPGWNPGGGSAPASATSRAQSRAISFYGGSPTTRYLVNIGNPAFRQFLIERIEALMDGSLYGQPYATGAVEGIMCDEAIYYSLFDEGVLEHTAEYHGVAVNDNHPYPIAFETFYRQLRDALRDHFHRERDVMPNYGNISFVDYPNRSARNVQAITAWIWAQVWVSYTGASSPNSGSARAISWDKDYPAAVLTVIRETRAGTRLLLGARDVSNGVAGSDRAKILSLALYYLVSNLNTFYMYETDAPVSTRITAFWNPAVTFDVGKPAPIPPNAVDFEGRRGTSEHWEFASGADPYRPDLTYHVVARRFTNALVLVKLLPEGSVVDDRSMTVHPLDGTYAVLQADGTLGPTVTEASLRNNEAEILIPVP